METHPLFPSGEWEGFYTYRYGPDAGRHPMHFILEFRDGGVTGSGGDEVGAFIWRGVYDKEALRCQMIKHYSSHVVYYEGHVDENGIWGTWYIPPFSSGGFHIWPKKKEAEESEEETVAETVESAEFIRVVTRTPHSPEYSHRRPGDFNTFVNSLKSICCNVLDVSLRST